jgi:hypothetical protein
MIKILLIVLAVVVTGVLILALTLGLLDRAGVLNPVLTVRASLKTAYIVAYDGGFWFEASGDANAPTAVGHDAGAPIPANYDVVIATGFIGTSDDQLTDVKQQTKIRIPEASVDLSYDRGAGPSDSGAYWSGPTHYDEYWINLLFPITGFKPPSGSKVYANHWWCLLTGQEQGLAKDLTADKKLPQGTYTVYYEETILQPMTGLDCIYDGPKTPYQAKPGTTVADPYTFTVGPPAP